jgi:hypothetical protein
MRRLALVIVGAMLAALGSAQIGFGPNGQPPIRWQTVAQGTDSHITRTQTRVIRTENDWSTHYKEIIGAKKADYVRAPRIANFMTEQVIVIHAGQKRSGGYTSYVESVIRRNAWDWDVNWVLTAPHQQASVTQGLTSPYVVIKMPKQVGVPHFNSRVFRSRQIVLNHGHGCGCCNAPPLLMYKNGKLVRIDSDGKETVISGGGGNRR